MLRTLRSWTQRRHKVFFITGMPLKILTFCKKPEPQKVRGHPLRRATVMGPKTQLKRLRKSLQNSKSRCVQFFVDFTTHEIKMCVKCPQFREI